MRHCILFLLLLLTSCAFANRANRPVWNAFESSLVPESNAAFYATLPLTVPIGLGAIFVDTFIAHPIQVVDEAWDDAVDVWDDIDFAEQFYSDSASLPFRAVGMPIVFLGSFLGRSTFDWESQKDAELRREESQRRRRVAALVWLGRVGTDEEARSILRLPDEVDEEIVDAVERALAGGSSHARMRIYAAIARCEDPTIVDWSSALGDESGVVRYKLLEVIPKAIEVSAAVQERLLNDRDPAVRERAERRFGR